MKKPVPKGYATRGHVIALDPTVAQAKALARAAGTARFTYNWALAEWDRQYHAGAKPSAAKLKKQFNALKGQQFPWVYESPRDANSQAFADLKVAFSNFFASCKGKRKGRKIGYPTFRKRGQDDCFYVANDKFHFEPDGEHVYLPVIGSVRIHEPLRFSGRIVGGRVRRVANRWYLSVQVVTDVCVPNAPLRPIVGVDLGVKTAVVPSQGDPIDAPKPLTHALKTLRRANRKLHRRTQGGSNRFKQRMRVARIHYRIANVRQDFAHKVTTKLVRENQTVVIEDLNVQGMLRNERLARAISDVGFGMIRRFLEYKGPIYGTEIVVADRWFPSSKRCHVCGHIRETLLLSERVYRCPACGATMDRDWNAALNLEEYPRLAGNWRQQPSTPMDDCASTVSAFGTASAVVEVGTKPCVDVRTF